LDAITDRKPILILGYVLHSFLDAQRAKAKRPCPPAHFYCLRCRGPKLPAGRLADFIPDTPKTGNLKGICPDCEGWIYRRASLRQLESLNASLDIQIQQADGRLDESAKPRVNCDFKGGPGADDKTQP
jgi:hypothetical protein